MRVFFDADLVGSRTSFTWDDGEISVNQSRDGSWIFESGGRRKDSIRAASEAAGCNLVLTPDVPQAKFWRKHTQHPAWHRILNRDQFSCHIREQVDAVIGFLKDPKFSYYLTTFQVQQDLIDRLATSRVKGDSLAQFGFCPDSGGAVPVPVYDNFSSSTGRMSVLSGPKILTLQRDLRSNIVSRWQDGEILEIDFNALEARVLSWMAGNEQSEGDFYTHVGIRANLHDTPRSVIKEATLSAIYGMSRRNFALRFQDIPDVIDVYERVKEVMCVQEIERKIQGMKSFQNAFGRPLSDTSAKISHYTQSSAVDVACHGFLELVKLLDSSSAVPIFLIHDAIILDVRKDYVDTVKEICKKGLWISIIDQYLPVKIKGIENE